MTLYNNLFINEFANNVINLFLFNLINYYIFMVNILSSLDKVSCLDF